MEHCPNGDLSKYLKEYKNFSEEVVKIIAAQILLAIEELHKMDVIYRDLKPENIVLDENFFVKLTDFGLSKEGVNEHNLTKSFCGSLAYLAPEVINREGHGKAVDWYLFGVLIYELLFCLPPYYTNQSREALFHNIKSAKLTFPYPISEEAKSLITKLLNRNPLKRLGSVIDAEEIKSHEFFKNIDFEKIYLKMFDPPVLNINSKDNIKIIPSKKNSVNKHRKIFTDKKTEDNKKLIENWTYILNSNSEDTNDEVIY
jgi:protein-serine/threonine kinase